MAKWKEEWGVEGGWGGGRGARRERGGGKRMGVKEVASPSDRRRRDRGEGQEGRGGEGKGGDQVKSSLFGDKGGDEDSASLSPGESWISSGSPPLRPRPSPLDPPPPRSKPPRPTLDPAMQKEYSDGSDADARESRGR